MWTMDSEREIIVDLTIHFHILGGGCDDFAMLNRNASAANLIQIRLLFRTQKSETSSWTCRVFVFFFFYECRLTTSRKGGSHHVWVIVFMFGTHAFSLLHHVYALRAFCSAPILRVLWVWPCTLEIPSNHTTCSYSFWPSAVCVWGGQNKAWELYGNFTL